MLSAIENFRATFQSSQVLIPVPAFQAIVWAALMLGALVAFGLHRTLIALIVLVLGATLPVTKKKKAPKGTEDWPEEKPSGTKA